jgi:hypothetical protein
LTHCYRFIHTKFLFLCWMKKKNNFSTQSRKNESVICVC